MLTARGNATFGYARPMQSSAFRLTAGVRVAFWRFAVALLAALATAASGATELAAEKLGLAQFGVQRWAVAEGLDSNWVRGLAVAGDGSLWVATNTSASRFDGHTFSPAGGASGNFAGLSISALALDAEGGIVLGTQYGGMIALGSKAGHARHREPRLQGRIVHDLAFGHDGALWVGTDAGLWVFVGNGDQGVPVSPDSDGTAAEVRTVRVAADGAVWARTARHGIWRVEGRTAVSKPDLAGCLGYGLAVGAGDERYMSCREGVWRWDAPRATWVPISAAFGVGRIHLDRRGDLWFGSREGLVRWSNGRTEVLPPERGIGDWRIRAIAEDARGDLWFGTFSGGLARLHRGPVRAYGAAEGLPVDATTAVLADEIGGLWVGALAGGVRRFHPERGPGEHWGREQGLPGDTAWALAADPRAPGAIWVGADEGLAWLSAGRLSTTGPRGERYAGVVNTLYADPADPETLWLSGADTGAVALRGATQTVHDEHRGLPIGRVRVFHRDRQGRLLAAGREGVFVLQGEHWQALDLGALRVDAVTALAEDAGGRLWVASERMGLLSVGDGEVHVWAPDAGMPFSPIHSIAFDDAGGVWLSGDQGLARIRLADHARRISGDSSSIPVERIGRRDGLREPECNGWGSPTWTRLADGRLAYPTIAGIGLVDLRALPSVGLSPPDIYIRQAFAGTRGLDLEDTLTLDRNERALRIAFSALELLRPEAVAFRYRLQGVDSDWIDAGGAREAAWSPLPAGEFQFALQARLPGQQWMDAGQRLTVTVTPEVWESTRLRLLFALLVLLLAFAAVRWRINVERAHTRVVTEDRDRLARSRSEARALSQRLLSAHEDERQRLAREIHDDLGQQLAGLSILAWSTAQAVDRDPTVSREAALRDLAIGIEGVARQVQSLSRELHSPALDALGLVATLRGECASFASRTGLDVRFVAAGGEMNVPPDVALALYRITQEALRNCLNHAKAQTLEVRLHAAAGGLELVIEDDGVGFDLTPTVTSGIGLSSMRERARLAGITLAITSQPGAGTRIAAAWRPTVAS